MSDLNPILPQSQTNIIVSERTKKISISNFIKASLFNLLIYSIVLFFSFTLYKNADSYLKNFLIVGYTFFLSFSIVLYLFIYCVDKYMDDEDLENCRFMMTCFIKSILTLGFIVGILFLSKSIIEILEVTVGFKNYIEFFNIFPNVWYIIEGNLFVVGFSLFIFHWIHVLSNNFKFLLISNFFYLIFLLSEVISYMDRGFNFNV